MTTPNPTATPKPEGSEEDEFDVRTIMKQDYIKLLESRLRIKAEDVPFPLSPDEGAIYNHGWMAAIQWALEILPDAPALAAPGQRVKEGWRLVPEEPNAEMTAASHRHL